jgi:O-antigen/teichoic acid export membrane protein
MSSEGRRGARGATVAIGGQAANSVVLVLAAVALPRLLGAVNYGSLSAILAVVTVLLVLSKLGLPLAEARFVAPLAAPGPDTSADTGPDTSRASELARLASSFWTLRLLASALAGCVVVVWLAASDPVASTPVAVAAGVFAAWRYAAQATRSLLLALDRVRAFVTLEVLQSLFFLVAFTAGYLRGGLTAAFLAVAIGEIGLFSLARRTVRTRTELSVLRFDRESLAPHMRYGAWAFVGSLATAVRIPLPVWLVAQWGGPRQAAYFGLAVQAFGLLLTILVSAHQTLLPILSELEARGETGRVWQWVGWLMRVSAAALTALALGWSLIGRDFLARLLGQEFVPAFEPIAWVLAAAILTAGGMVANGFLFVRQRARAAALHLVAVAVFALAGLALVLGGETEHAATRAGIVYLLTGAVYVLLVNGSIRWIEGRWLPLGRFVALAAPAALAWPASAWQAPLPQRLTGAALLVAGYWAGALATRLIRPSELRYLASLLSPGRAPRSSPAG